MKTILNTIASPFTLDMYSTFTTDSTDNMILENLREDNLPCDYDDYDWTYDMDAIHKKLASLWCEFVLDYYNQYMKNENIIIKDCKVLSIHRPKYYNYTTDSSDIEVSFDKRKMEKFIKANAKAYEKFTEPREFNTHYSSNPMEDDSEKISFYMESISESEDLYDKWIDFAFDNISETMYNSVDYTLITK